MHISLATQIASQDPKESLLSLAPFYKTRLAPFNNFLLSFFLVTSVVTQNTFKVFLGTFDLNCSLFFSRFNKKEEETLPIFRLLGELELPGGVPHRCDFSL